MPPQEFYIVLIRKPTGFHTVAHEYVTVSAVAAGEVALEKLKSQPPGTQAHVVKHVSMFEVQEDGKISAPKEPWGRRIR